MIKSWYAIEVYGVGGLQGEVFTNDYPTDEEIENAILEVVGCDGFAVVTTRHKIVVPFA